MATDPKKSILVMLMLLALGAPAFPLGAREPITPAQPATTIIINDQGGFTAAISRVAEALMPAVVHIEVTGTVMRQAPGFFFGPMQHEQAVPVQSLGSGVLISSDGYVITNNHVVENADSIEVELYGGVRRKAALVGRDPLTDLAVIKIDPAEGTSFGRFGDSDGLKVGEWVIAIGSPRGLDSTVTAGIVSAKHRTDIGALGPSGYEDFIQTDASINPGNSGGPLINLRGEIVGINSLIVSGSQGSEGLGFAIPARMAKEISDALISDGKVVRGSIGIDSQDVTPEIAAGLSLPLDRRGAIVDDVDPAGPAAAAGVQRGDIVVRFAGSTVDSSSQLRALVAGTRPGTVAEIAVLRKGREVSLTARVEDLERATQRLSQAEESALLGLAVEPLTPEVARKIGLRRLSGVVVTSVLEGSAASRARLDPGDVIFMVGDSEVSDAQGFASLIGEAIRKGKVVLLIRDVRTGRMGYIQVPVSGN